MDFRAYTPTFATTLNDSNSSNSDLEESCDGDGKYNTIMTIAPMDSSDDFGTLVEELSEHTKVESIGVGEESDDEDEECSNEGAKGLQESCNSLLEKTEEYARVAKAAIRKMKKSE